MDEFLIWLLAGLGLGALLGWRGWRRRQHEAALQQGRADRERVAVALAEAQRLTQAEQHAAAEEQAATERAAAAAARIEAERAAVAAAEAQAEREAAERAEAAQAEAQQAAAARAEAERRAAAQAEAERAAAAEAQAQRAAEARLQAERDERAAAARAEAERAASAQAEADRIAAARAEAQRAAAAQAAAQAEAQRLAAVPPVPAAPPAPPPASTAAARVEQPLVMVADDSKVVRVKTGRLLALHQYRVCYAADGLDAVQQLQTTAPDVVITDVEMPGMDGFALTRHIRGHAATAHIPVIMITAADDRHREQAAEAGVSVLLGKPYPEDALIAHIRQATGAPVHDGRVSESGVFSALA